MKLMINQEAIRILEEQRNKFMDEWVDFGGVNEAYNMAIDLLKDHDETELCDRCGRRRVKSNREVKG